MILGTLLLQGLTLPPLIKLLGVDDYDEDARAGGDRAPGCAATEAALARLDELADEEWVLEDTVERVRGAYRYRQRRFTARSRDGEFDGGARRRRRSTTRPARWPTSGWSASCSRRSAATLIELRDRGEINDDVLRRIERELDLEDSRLEI